MGRFKNKIINGLHTLSNTSMCISCRLNPSIIFILHVQTIVLDSVYLNTLHNSKKGRRMALPILKQTHREVYL